MISKIVDTVYRSTINGNLKWEPSNSIFNSDTRHKYQALSSDGKTKFTCDITLNPDMSLKAGSYDTVDIHNDSIVDGVARCYTRDNKNASLIYEWIYNNKVKNTLAVKNQHIVYDDIMKSIDTSEYRDQKISQVLDDVKKVTEKEEVKEEVEVKDERKGFLKKLFGK